MQGAFADDHRQQLQPAGAQVPRFLRFLRLRREIENALAQHLSEGGEAMRMLDA